MPELEKTLALNPTFPSGEATLARAYADLGRDSDSMAHWRKALVQAPDDVNAQVGAARILASSPDDAIRNGQQAVALARKAADLTKDSVPSVLDTLAAAYAEEGQYHQAVETANQALALAQSKGLREMAESIRYRIGLYANNQPFRDVR